MQIGADPLLQQFFKMRGQKKATRERYIYVMKLWQTSTGQRPTNMIEEAEEEEDQQIRPRKRSIDQHFLTFTDHMKARGFTVDSIKSNTSYIRAFYNHYHIQLPGRIKLETPPHTDLQLPSLEDIRLALSNSNPCFQAIIILMLSSGMGRSEILSLTLTDFIMAVNARNKDNQISLESLPCIGETIPDHDKVVVRPLIWNVTRIKTGRHYYTFSSSESYQFIMRYLASKPGVEDPDSSLFLNQSRRQIQHGGFNQYFRDLNKRCGWGKIGKQIYFRSHNLRKWFASRLENGLGYINTERLMAHSVLSDTANRYFKPDIEVIYNLYYQNMDRVTVMGKVEVHDNTREEVKQLKEDLERVKRLLEMQENTPK